MNTFTEEKANQPEKKSVSNIVKVIFVVAILAVGFLVGNQVGKINMQQPTNIDFRGKSGRDMTAHARESN